MKNFQYMHALNFHADTVDDKNNDMNNQLLRNTDVN